MSSLLSPDTEAELKREFGRGIDDLRGGRAMPIGGLVLYRDTRERLFIVHCYSSCDYAENITRKEAEECIATAKEELNTLVRLFPELCEHMNGLDLAFHFCYGTSKGGVLAAKEEHGHFEYLANVA
jgi:hypothetical protein